MRRFIVGTTWILLAAGSILPNSRRAFAQESPVSRGPATYVALCAPAEPGDRLEFSGRVLDYAGRPLSGAAVVAYGADQKGLYNPPGSDTRVPRLRGVAVTDTNGWYGFSTIRPGAYPNRSEPAHLHLSVTAPAHHVRYLEYWFEGDPLITPSLRERASRNPSTVIVRLERSESGMWSFRHDIRLEGN
jgi:protocatechuate 3,4-dioxygenase beta subunit